jgi:hypothetical protein
MPGGARGAGGVSAAALWVPALAILQKACPMPRRRVEEAEKALAQAPFSSLRLRV